MWCDVGGGVGGACVVVCGGVLGRVSALGQAVGFAMKYYREKL